ncbi:hypothetical protein [Alteribacillus iranensis]|uniref:Uncharacterized protein n=1 Tax=Alteribacillus iranensis TaxID=930128 RepID=A0A1I2C0Y2_9BACI|nr:hypothetical protein [Alteribacillus iranensis]SFE61808.1 hypothetical protein SAMN05192532_102613 [Alteribacillus iranensis]
MRSGKEAKDAQEQSNHTFQVTQVWGSCPKQEQPIVPGYARTRKMPGSRVVSG